MAWSTRVMVFWIASQATLYAAPAKEAKPAALSPSATCGECHRQIHEMWQRSMHAASATDPVFLASYLRALQETGGKADAICLPCHSPAGARAGDRWLRDPGSQEGITCDFCHSAVSVDLSRRGQRLQIALDGVKRGPLADAVSPAHDIAQSDLHRSAEFCAACHEYESPEGLAIFSTYTEWRASAQAREGKVCQDCHMPMTPGQTVKPEIGVYRKEINLHDISGGHSAEQVRKAATTRIVRVERVQPAVAAIEVELTNVGSGHSIPTGLPTRKLVLGVSLFCDGRLVRHFEREFQKVLLDAQGRVITEDHRAILNARAIREDTRLQPGEQRIERFVADVPKKGALSAQAVLQYLYEPELLSRRTMSIEMGSHRFPEK